MQTEVGLFTPENHKDELAKAIGTKEHGGRVRGVSSSATWKEGFSDTSSHLYKKHTLNQKEREDKAKEDWRRQLLMFAIDKESGRLDPNLQATMDAFLRGSSTSTQSSISMQPSVSGQPSVPMQSETENITEDTPCELHVPFRYKRKTMKVASGTVFPGEKLHNRDIPLGYVRVTVLEIVPSYEDNEIECSIPEVEPKDQKAKSDVDKYLAALKKCLASTGKLILQEEDPRDVLPYDDQILENPVDDVDYPKFILDKPLISNNMYKNLPWKMRKLHDWYMMVSKERVTKITCRIPKEVFNEDDEQILYLFWEDVHLMFRLDQMDVTFITMWCIMNTFSKERRPIEKIGGWPTSTQAGSTKARSTQRDHWICLMIFPKEGYLLSLDSLDYDKNLYDDILEVIHRAYEKYVIAGGTCHPIRKKKMYFHHKF
ncbi:hypothetical protein QOZ80_9AG0678430 [Eleusine coracana subsp. coracana]|nr:hypothetical protein QOZ80_9AG0678430 [Eleusine coracana subsp. coracana]